MTFTKILSAISVAGLLLSAPAFAQTATPAAPAATAPAMPDASAPMDKKAKSKMCSDEATKQGLHGKARKAYRSKCKMGKM